MQAERMAYFCQATGMPPSEFKALTYTEYLAFVSVVRERSK